MRGRPVAVACASALLVACLARAEDLPGWRETRWGMTVDEALSALNGEARRIPDAKEFMGHMEALEIPSYSVGPYEFRATLRFTGGKLTAVVLTGAKDSGAWYPGLMDMLVAKYGAAASEAPNIMGRSARWNFPSTRITLNHVRAPGMGPIGIISLSYGPPEKGLDKL